MYVRLLLFELFKITISIWLFRDEYLPFHNFIVSWFCRYSYI